MRVNWMLRSRVFVLAALAGLVAWPRSGHATGEASKAACVDAAHAGQELRDSGQLLAAAERFVACSAGSCPAVVRGSCTTWLDEVERRIPSIAVAVVDAQGRDVLPTRVLLDLRPEPALAVGRAVRLDPGAHEIVIEAGELRGSERIVVREGERDRQVRVVLPASGPQPAPQPAAGTASRAAAPSPWAYVLGGLGVVLLGSSVALGLHAQSEADRLRSSCAPSCADSEVDPVRTELWIGEATLAGGILALGGATWWLLSSTEGDGVSVGIGPGAATVRTRF